MIRRLGSATAAVLMLATVLAAPAEARRIDEVRAKVHAVIDDLGIDRSRIRQVFVAADDDGGEAPGTLSYSAWIAFSDCTGNLAMHLSGTTAVRTIYTTGDCAVPGVSRGG
ncbi:hypothetical protein T8K17_22230 [Thalassobaculum sp. OXR-137]|uniref:hypothetical protein n=1 Tax=Thalassobaculum sp. OXR-137 TaxID=3100173 RepID=UPI002AC9ED75|nr:hypothetical protein [Thalassobaculum sp. OXR-137]WPZ33945.1 hypothetical protein T8K17_22230 [Thalassobaculum sp. OXR-137]